MAKSKRPTHTKNRLSKAGRASGVAPTEEKLSKSLKATKWGESALTKFLIDAEQNTKITYLQHKAYFELFDGLSDLFGKARQEVGYHDMATFAECLLFYRSIGSFLAAIRLATAGQIAECFVQLRVCIESALYAFGIKEDSTLASIWINRHDDKKSLDLCRNSFTVNGLLKRVAAHNKSLHDDIRAQYDECINLGGHPNERSLTLNIKFLPDDPKMVLELLNTQPPVFQMCMAACCLAGSSVARVFASVYSAEFAKANADIRLSNIMSQLRTIAAPTLLDLPGKPRGGDQGR
jgi:hypothetical protein